MLRQLIRTIKEARTARRKHDVATGNVCVETLLRDAQDASSREQHDLAESIFLEILNEHPDNVDSLQHLARVYAITGRYDQAQVYILKALSLSPESAALYCDFGNICKLQKKLVQATKLYCKAVSINPEHIPAHYNLGLVYRTQGNTDRAIDEFREALHIDASYSEALDSLVDLLLDGAMYREAFSELKRILSHDPDNIHALQLLGMVHRRTGNVYEAVACYERNLLLDTNSADAYFHLGKALREAGKIEQSISCFEEARKITPDDCKITWQRAISNLMNRNYSEGWDGYELRLLSLDPPCRKFGYKRWDGEPLIGKTILVYAEQGIGDEIMFLSCLPDLFNREPGRVIIDCSYKLAPLIARSFPSAIVHGGIQADSGDWLREYTDIDYEVPIGSLPKYFRLNLKDFTQHNGYLQADQKCVEYWRARLEGIGPGIKIGLSWRGGTFKTRRTVKSVPLDSLIPPLSMRNAQFINLQYDSTTDELGAVYDKYGVRIQSWDDALDDYDMTAALVTALDLVISVQTAVAHLGGALGRPVWTMVPFSPEWVYGINGSDMPWYPSAKIYRQQKPNDWSTVVDNLSHDLYSLSMA